MLEDLLVLWFGVKSATLLERMPAVAGHEVCDIVGKIMLGQVSVKSLEFWFGMT